MKNMFRNSFSLLDQVKKLIYQYDYQNNCTILCFAPWCLLYSAHIMPKIPRILNIPRKNIFFVWQYFLLLFLEICTLKGPVNPGEDLLASCTKKPENFNGENCIHLTF